MKPIAVITITGIFILFMSVTSFSQTANGKLQTTIIEPFPLKISLNKTTNLIFPLAIKSVDRGSGDVLAQKAKGVENILLVKAGKENFLETNLSVITADGKLYSFVLDYINNPATINISFSTDTANANVSSSLNPDYYEASMHRDEETILKKKKKLHGVRDDRYDLSLILNGIYIKDDIIFLRVEIGNRSNINYDIDMLSFLVKDEKKTKRTASQEIEIHPLYKYGNASTIKANSKNNLVIALPKFTIPDKQYVLVQLTEKNGGRNLRLRIGNKAVVKASKI